MLNVIPEIIEALRVFIGTEAEITTLRPTKDGKVPAVTVTEEDNSVEVWAGGKENLSRLRERIDIWAKTSTADLAAKADAAMASLGFKRIGAQDASEDGLKHRVQRYEALVQADGKPYAFHAG